MYCGTLREAVIRPLNYIEYGHKDFAKLRLNKITITHYIEWHSFLMRNRPVPSSGTSEVGCHMLPFPRLSTRDVFIIAD